MINHNVANAIKTGRELEDYFLENLEIGDKVKSGGGGSIYVIIARTDKFFWAQTHDDRPVTLGVGDMDSIKE